MPQIKQTIKFIKKHEVPGGGRATYTRIAVDYQPQKSDPNRVRLTVGGDRVDYPWDVSTPTADLITTKLLLNSTISTKGAKFMTADINFFYLNTPMEHFEYMQMAYNLIPAEVIQAYGLD